MAHATLAMPMEHALRKQDVAQNQPIVQSVVLPVKIILIKNVQAASARK
jgi:hypothetical protein